VCAASIVAWFVRREFRALVTATMTVPPTPMSVAAPEMSAASTVASVPHPICRPMRLIREQVEIEGEVTDAARERGESLPDRAYGEVSRNPVADCKDGTTLTYRYGPGHTE
jgi:hypothetical protein